MKCSKCGYENRQTAQFCQRCGAALPADSSSNRPGSRKRARKQTRPIEPQPSSQPSATPKSSMSDTRPLVEASVAFAPLPEGALLHDGQYVISELDSSDEQLNVYTVESFEPARVCANCQTETFDLDDQFCSSCGADISNIAPLHLHYRVRESADVHAFASQVQLLEMQLIHPGLSLPHHTFVESPYGPPRRYLVEPEFLPPLATSLSVPQPLNRVLEWGLSLAQAMDYLHQHQITLREANLNQIAVSGRKARWVHLNRAYVIPPEARSTAESFFAEDVRRLAEDLSYLATGPQRTIPGQMPEEAATAFSQALEISAGIAAADFATALESALQALRHPASITLSVGHRSDVGQERSLNEDSLLNIGVSPVYHSASTPLGLFAVADGMGGHSAGDVASRLAIQALEQHAISDLLSTTTTDKPLPNPHEWITTTTLAANQSVYEQRKAAGTDMGTTLVLALIIGDMATIGNVGDSRAYLLSEDGIVQITTDHSLVERLVATGQITREEAAYHPQRNVIYRVVGDKPRVEPDVFKQRLTPGEALLLCSDGLNNMVPDEQIWHIWRSSAGPQEACDQLVQTANQAGGVDNITVVIVQVAG
jgi:serine/threonine protein phosphatase PrpC